LKATRNEADEKHLVETAQADPRCFADLYEAYFERVYAFVARRVQLRADAEDLTAEVFQQALAHLGTFHWRGVPFSAWLYRIAANAIADRWQLKSREQGSPAGDHWVDRQPRIDEVEQSERRAKLYRSVNALPSEQRRIIEMRFVEEKSIREIAQEMKRTVGAIKQLQFRAIRSLRAQWDQGPGRRTRKAHG
jgi:RNA polymerase sigma-70 factor, ECF subfamily